MFFFFFLKQVSLGFEKAVIAPGWINNGLHNEEPIAVACMLSRRSRRPCVCGRGDGEGKPDEGILAETEFGGCGLEGRGRNNDAKIFNVYDGMDSGHC